MQGRHPFLDVSLSAESGYSGDRALSSELWLFAFNHGACSCLIKFKSYFATVKEIPFGMK